MTPLLTYDQALEQAGEKPSLLLGNGFFIAYDKDLFSYTSLLDSAVTDGILEEGSHVYKLFQQLETSDFESVMKLLDQSQQVVEIYEGDETLRARLNGDSTLLKNYLVEIITKKHPAHIHSVTDEKKAACRNWLAPYECIFTLNYDLLLYWASLDQYEDGFRNTEDSRHEGYVVYQNKEGFTVHYLHGAMHLFDDGDQIIKRTYNNTGRLLIDQIKESLEKGIYPIFISEGNSSQKMAKILHNAYLNHCYKSLKSRPGTKSLIIFGTLLKDNDQHILDAILHSNVRQIFIGTKDEASIEHLRIQIAQRNRSLRDNLQKFIIPYNYTTTNPWQAS